MKTALQTAIEKIDFAIQMWKDPANEMYGLHTLETLKQDVINLLEAEKQQIEQAYITGRDECHLDYYPKKHATEYYNEKFSK